MVLARDRADLLQEIVNIDQSYRQREDLILRTHGFRFGGRQRLEFTDTSKRQKAFTAALAAGTIMVARGVSDSYTVAYALNRASKRH